LQSLHSLPRRSQWRRKRHLSRKLRLCRKLYLPHKPQLLHKRRPLHSRLVPRNQLGLKPQRERFRSHALRLHPPRRASK
jgi:hypothetical protein